MNQFNFGGPIMDPRIPRGVAPGGAVIRPLTLQVRTLLEYDADHLRDRVRADLFVNGEPCGIYAVALVEDYPHDELARRVAIERHGPALERSIVDLLMGHEHRRRITELEYEVEALRAGFNRIRWWQLRRRWAARKGAQA